MNRDRPDCAIDQRAARGGPLAMMNTLVKLSKANGETPPSGTASNAGETVRSGRGRRSTLRGRPRHSTCRAGPPDS